MQESWHLPGGESKFSRFPGFHFHAVSGMDISSGPISGRPYGGVVILYRKSISKLVEHISTASARLCVIRLKSAGHSCIIINCYMPCDDRSTRQEHVLELSETLRIIELNVKAQNENR